MKNMGIVQGSKEAANTPFFVCVDTVYLRFNPAPIPPPEDGGEDLGMMAGEIWEYHEIQYTLREWLQILTEITIDTASLALNLPMIEELNALATNSEEIGGVSIEQTYAGLPAQKPFTYTPRFTQRRN